MIRPPLRLLCLALLVATGPLPAQDFPVDPPRRPSPVGPELPPLLARPEASLPAAELVTPFQLLDRFVLPGSRQALQWVLPDGLGRGELPSPIIIVHGARPGPVLCLIAGIHGDEVNGIEVARRLGHEVDPSRLRGTLVVAPIVNVFGFSRISRFLPDRRDLNRHFPCSRSGSIAARMAHGFFNDVVRHCDALVDFHTGSFQRTNLPQIRANLSEPSVLELTRGFGNTLVLHSEGTRGMLRVAAVAAGIPAVTFEVGAPQFIELHHIEPAAEAIRILMDHKGMLARESTDAAAPDPAPIYFDSRWVRTNASGFLFAEIQLGQTVTLGQRLGHVIDPVTSERTDIVSPFPGQVLGKALNQLVLPGYAAFHIGRLTNEQQAVLQATDPAAADDEVGEDPAERPATERPEPERE